MARAPESLSLESSLTALSGVGPKRAELFARLGLGSVEALLRYPPRDYEDRGPLRTVEESLALSPGTFAAVRGHVKKCHLRRHGRRSTLRAVVEDSTGSVVALWFNAPFLASEIAAGSEIAISGRLSKDHALLQPEFRVLDDGESYPARFLGIRPVYALTEGISSKLVGDLVGAALDAVDEIEDSLSEEVRAVGQVIGLREAIVAAHRPRSIEEANEGRDRLLFDELLPIEVAMRRRISERHARPAPASARSGRGADEFVATLPFSLSPSQRNAVADIVDDLSLDRPMTRMLAGEVGSGKTVVALAALEEARVRGMQGALLAPTDLLARQHARAARELLPGADQHVVLLTGTLPAPEAAAARRRLESGEASIAIGTHALLSETTRFPRLGLVVVDEQHRFGVEQREALLAQATTPHSLLLTATPIPRSLALLAFGDADVSVLEPRADARAEVVTRLVPRAKRAAALRWMRERLEKGEQAFFVRPRIDGEGAGAAQLFEELAGGALPGVRCEIVHGRLAADEREERLRRFREGEIAALVATTVVEVGIDVPGATLLWIEGAERLGLAQLHQLRGRIARRGQKGYCWIVEGPEATEASQERLRVLTEVSDGMRLAEIDLALRGPGELLGLRQSGRLGLFQGLGADAPRRLSSLAERAWRCAELIVDSRSTEEGTPCSGVGFSPSP